MKKNVLEFIVLVLRYFGSEPASLASGFSTRGLDVHARFCLAFLNQVLKKSKIFTMKLLFLISFFYCLIRDISKHFENVVGGRWGIPAFREVRMTFK